MLFFSIINWVGGIGFFLDSIFKISTFHLAIFLINLFPKYGGKKVVVFPLTKPLAIATVGRLIGGLQNLVLGNTTYNVRFFFTMQRVLNQRCGFVHRQPLLRRVLPNTFVSSVQGFFVTIRLRKPERAQL